MKIRNYKLDMKLLLLFACGSMLLLASTGCVVHEHEARYHRYHYHDEVIVSPPAVEVRPPAVIVH